MLRDEDKKDDSLRECVVRFNNKNRRTRRLYIEPMRSFESTHSNKTCGWAELDFFKCPGCTLPEHENHYCPAALSVASLLSAFCNCFSTEPVTVEAVDRIGRKTLWNVSLQDALFVLIRTAMLFSGCPVTEELRPFITDLRPFSTNREIVEAIATRALLVFNHNREAARQDVYKRLSDFHSINVCLAERLRSLKGDALVNALIIVDVAAIDIEMHFDNVCRQIEDDSRSIGRTQALNHR